MSVMTCVANTPVGYRLLTFRKLVIQHFISNYDDIAQLYVSYQEILSFVHHDVILFHCVLQHFSFSAFHLGDSGTSEQVSTAVGQG